MLLSLFFVPLNRINIALYMKKVDSSQWDQLKFGDKRSFEIIFKAYYLQLCLFSRQFTKDMDDAREVVQELFIYLWENRERMKEIDSLQSYIYASLRFNSIRKFNSRPFKNTEIANIPEEELGIDFHDTIEYAQLQQAIFETIELLPPQCQKIFKMSRFERLTYLQIASILKISPKTVEVHMSKALRELHQTLNKYLQSIILLF